MPSTEIHEWARTHPEAFDNVVGYCDGRVGEKLAEVAKEEQPTEQERTPVTAD